LPYAINNRIIFGRDIHLRPELGRAKKYRRIPHAKKQLLCAAVALGFGVDGIIAAETGHIARIDIKIDVGIAPGNQVADVVILPCPPVTTADKPGTVFGPATTERGHRRGNKLPVDLGAFAVQKQAKQAAAIAYGRLRYNHRNG